LFLLLILTYPYFHFPQPIQKKLDPIGDSMAINPANCNIAGAATPTPGANDIGGLSNLNSPTLTSNLSVNPPLMTNAALSSSAGNNSTGAMLDQIILLVCTLVANNMPNASVPANSAGAAVNTTTNTVANTPPLTDTTTDPKNKATLDQSLAVIANDPDGAKLIAKAKKLGVSIQVGNPATAAGANDVTIMCPTCAAILKAQKAGDFAEVARLQALDPDGGQGQLDQSGSTTGAQDSGVIVNGVTLSDNKTGKINIVVRDPSNIKTIAHELVHAVSTQDGDSKQEEGIADVIGSHVANRNGGAAVGGLSGSDEQIYENKQQFYPNLMDTNNIRQTLAALGLLVSV
jgi:hypothetical protein